MKPKYKHLLLALYLLLALLCYFASGFVMILKKYNGLKNEYSGLKNEVSTDQIYYFFTLLFFITAVWFLFKSICLFLKKTI